MFSFSILLYPTMAIIAILISFRVYFLSRKKPYSELHNFYPFFIFVAINLLLLFLINLLKNSLSLKLLTQISLLARISVLVAIIYLFLTPIIQQNLFVRSNKKILLWSIILIIFFSTLFRIFFYSEISVNNSGTIWLNLHFIPATMLSLATLSIGLLWLTSLLKFLKKDDHVKLKAKVYLLSYGGIILAIGDTVFLTAHTAIHSTIGSIISILGYIIIMLGIYYSYILRNKYI
jgi:hypothetical protein